MLPLGTFVKCQLHHNLAALYYITAIYSSTNWKSGPVNSRVANKSLVMKVKPAKSSRKKRDLQFVVTHAVDRQLSIILLCYLWRKGFFPIVSLLAKVFKVYFIKDQEFKILPLRPITFAPNLLRAWLEGIILGVSWSVWQRCIPVPWSNWQEYIKQEPGDYSNKRTIKSAIQPSGSHPGAISVTRRLYRD